MIIDLLTCYCTVHIALQQRQKKIQVTGRSLQHTGTKKIQVTGQSLQQSMSIRSGNLAASHVCFPNALHGNPQRNIHTFYVGTLIAYRHIVFKLEKISVKNCARKQSNMCCNIQTIAGGGQGGLKKLQTPTHPPYRLELKSHTLLSHFGPSTF